MNRLWVRISAGIGLSLFLVFFLQFLAIRADMAAPRDEFEAPPDAAEIERRLVGFFFLSALVGVAGGSLVAASVVLPLRRISRAVENLGAGQPGARAPERGARELAQLGRSFNAMADALARAETERTNLFADLSHELRTPLAALEANLQAALDGVYALDPPALAGLLEQARYLGRLVNDLRELSLSESGRLPLDLAKLDLSDLCRDVAEALEPLAAERSVRLSLAGPACLMVRGDDTRLRQVLFNLLANAIRHAKEGGRVELRCGPHPAQERPQDGWAVPMVLVEVEDDGTGLASEEIAAIFDRFYRTDPSRSRDRGGSGLGLAIAKALVEEHGGVITVRSEGRGKGAVFLVSLPVEGPSLAGTVQGEEGS